MKIKSELLDEVIEAWNKYSSYVEKYNNLVQARNTRRLKKHKEDKPGRISPPEDLEAGKEKSLIGFMEYLNEKKS